MQPGALVIINSTGLKVYGKDEWHQEKHAVAARRTWRKLHLAVDENHQLLACELTTPEVGDPTAVADLLDQIDAPFETFIGDGAYDADTVSKAVLTKQSDALIVVPPPKTAVCFSTGDTQRDDHIREIKAHGRNSLAKEERLRSARTCRAGNAALQAHHRVSDESAQTAATKDRSMGQCVRVEHHV
jgi:Transposase DDE domain